MSTFQSKRDSSSRLSPLARPFTINRSNSTFSNWPQQHSSSAPILLPRSFSDFTSQVDSIASTPYYTLFDTSPASQFGNHSYIIGPNSNYSQYLPRDFQLPVDSKSAMIYKNVTGGNQEERIDQGRYLKNKNAIVSVSSGNTRAGEISDRLHGKWIGISEKDLQFDRYDSLSYHNPFICNPVSVKELDTPLDTSDREVSHQILLDKSKDGENGKRVIDEVTDSLALPKFNIQSTDANVPSDFTLKLPSAGASEPVDNSSKVLGENDSDLDSPCWKGTLASNQKTFADFGSVNSYLKVGQESLSNLNPMASHWLSSNDKESINYYGNEHGGLDSLFYFETASSTVHSLSREHRSANSVPAGSSSSDLRNTDETQCYNDIHIPHKEYALKNSCCSSLLSFSSMLHPPLVGNHRKSEVQHMTVQNVAVSMRGTENNMTVQNVAVSMRGTENNLHSIFSQSKSVCSSSSCRVEVPSDFSEKHGGGTRSFSRPPSLDMQKMVITMNKLSELLMQNCSNDMHSLNEHELDIIKHIINNLNMCMGNRIGETTLTLESSHPNVSFCSRKSADLQKVRSRRKRI